ncbi:MAG TPA: glycine zipper family protein, partial [Stellaceae bacterium]|nr:glycine zipper family protein [Stellaceae bacterium]
MNHVQRGVAVLAAAGVLAGCAQPPLGPTVPVMPAANKPFPVFQQEDAYCRQFAQQQTAGTAETANNAQFGTAVIGTVLGAGLGAALGGGQGA